MEAETCMRFAANVRESGFGLYSYLSSGKSYAIAISLRPTSFHCSIIAADGTKAGFGGYFGLCDDGHRLQKRYRAQTGYKFHSIHFSLLRSPGLRSPHFESCGGAAASF